MIKVNLFFKRDALIFKKNSYKSDQVLNVIECGTGPKEMPAYFSNLI